MFHFRFAAVIVLLLLSGSCLAQADLALINDDGKTVGWLLAKNAGQYSSQYMTPDGYIMSVNSGGFISRVAKSKGPKSSPAMALKVAQRLKLIGFK